MSTSSHAKRDVLSPMPGTAGVVQRIEPAPRTIKSSTLKIVKIRLTQPCNINQH